jgi:hypothetical protein
VSSGIEHLESRELGHLDIEKDQVRFELVDEPERHASILRFTHDFQPVDFAGQFAQCLASQGLVFSDQRS